MNNSLMKGGMQGSKAELNAILENAPVGILFSNRRLLMQANRLCAEMFGYTPDEFIGQAAVMLWPSAEAYEALGREAGPLLAAGEPFRTETQLKRKDGSLFWCRMSAKAVNVERVSEGTLWFMEDITAMRQAMTALETTSNELSAIFEAASIGIAVSAHRHVLRANRRLHDMLGVEQGRLVGQPLRRFFMGESDYQTAQDEAIPELAAGGVYRREHKHPMKDGWVLWLRITARAINAAEYASGVIWLVEDVTSRRESEERAQRAFDEQQMIFDNAAVGILFARERVVQRCNARLAAIYGYTPDELVGRSTRVFHLTEQDYQRATAEAEPVIQEGQTWSGDVRARHRDGTPFWVRMTGRRSDAKKNDEDVIWIFEDVTEKHRAEDDLLRVQDELEQRIVERTAELTTANAQLQSEVFERIEAEQRIWKIAHHDGLTGLPNRILLHDRLGQALAQAQRNQHRLAVMFLDLDRFKSINDTLGHDVGDELLKHVAQRLSDVVRAADTVSRIGGDEFVVVLPEIDAPEDAGQVAEKILQALAGQVTIKGHQLRATPSIGISVYPDDGEEIIVLMKCADTAMYHAKAKGRNAFQFFDPRLDADAMQYNTQEARLRQAIDAGQLLLHYQPRIDVATGTVCGIEALLRWRDPERGLIMPGDFLPQAEETGLICPLGEWVLAEALQQNRQWQQEGRPLLPMSVNLSPRQFRDPALPTVIGRLLAASGQPAKLLELEIRAGALMQDFDASHARLTRLAALGVSLVIDDFGAGLVDLSQLRQWPLSALKPDRGFVSGSTGDLPLMRALLALAQGLGSQLIVKGVETRASFKVLQDAGIVRFQGNLFAEPLPTTEAERIFGAADVERWGEGRIS